MRLRVEIRVLCVALGIFVPMGLTQPIPHATSLCDLPDHGGTPAYQRFCVAVAPPSQPAPSRRGTPPPPPQRPAVDREAEARKKERLEAIALNDQGLALRDSGDFEGAERCLRQALEELPGDPTIEKNLQYVLDCAAAALAEKKRKAAEQKARDWAQQIDNSIAVERGQQIQSSIAVTQGQQIEDSIRTAQIAARENSRTAASTKSQADAILAGIRKIKVPPPILPQDAQLAFGELVPDDKSERIMLGSDAGVAVIDIFGKLGGATVPAKLLLVAGKTFIAGENGADVYVTRQNDTYEKALAYLKDPKQALIFSELVRDARENHPFPENASIDMARAAQAIVDPHLGNSGKRIAWDAMFSPEARNAILTQACIELAGHVAGQLAEKRTEKLAERILAAHDPAFEQASDFLVHARVALERVHDPATLETLNIAVKQANDTIAASFKVLRPQVKAYEHGAHLFFTSVPEKAVERSLENTTGR